ncbi:MAG: hypothetical protein K6B70_05885 [Clostridia bacterium]|nr:hypothetical protein [Clostridia bacterium]
MDGKELRKKLQLERNYCAIIDYKYYKTEEKMLEQTAALLRMNYAGGSSNKGEKDRREFYEDELKEKPEQTLKQMKEMVDNYKMPELMLYIMWNSHTDWILDNIDNTDLSSSKDAYKFAPFALLDWDTVNEQYFKILAPIFDSLEIEYDTKNVQEKFEQSQEKFLSTNNINSAEALKQKMQEDIKEIYPGLVSFKNCKGKNIVDVLHNDKIINNICNQIQKRNVFNIGKKDSLKFEDDFCR